MNTPFHLVNISPWPLLTGINSFSIVVNLVAWIWLKSTFILVFSLSLQLIILYQWWRDVIRESTWQGHHTIKVQGNLKRGRLLFIISEIMFFVSFFWTFFHLSLSPNIELNIEWPPIRITTFDPLGIPLLNTIILLSSGVTLTWAHFSLLNNNLIEYKIIIIGTILLAIIFTLLQLYEYCNAPFTIADSAYGSIFFLATGFHGFHVIIGSIFLITCLIRANHLIPTHHVGLELGSWYWHFVDVVWLFLYICVYWWGA